MKRVAFGSHHHREGHPGGSSVGPWSRLAVFLFGTLPSDAWRAPIWAWVGLGGSGVLLLASHALRHAGWYPRGLDAPALATAASIGGNALLCVVIVGMAIARVRHLTAPSAEE